VSALEAQRGVPRGGCLSEIVQDRRGGPVAKQFAVHPKGEPGPVPFPISLLPPVRHFLELVPVIGSWVEPSLSRRPSYSRGLPTNAEGRVILSPPTTTSIPVTASGSRALRRHVARIHIVDHGRFGEGESLKLSGLSCPRSHLPHLAGVHRVIGPGARGECRAMRPQPSTSQ
jgi:hypothetical protein